jgi:ribosomal protein S18 acetylase RimI-like enzyme
MDPEPIVEMELLTSEFWPAETRVTTPYGWVLGSNSGVTWRANCVFPYGEPRNLLSAVREVERFYDEHGTHTAFKLTAATELTRKLDTLLQKRGYEKYMITYVQTRDLSTNPAGSTDAIVTLESNLSDRWLQKQAVDERYHGENLQVLRGIINRIPGTKAFALVESDSELVGVGLGVVHRGWLALFSIRTDPDVRRMGIGGAISDTLLSWGAKTGAQNAFLQVEADNGPAISLYRKRGFGTAYTYWYRIKKQPKT